MDSVLTSIKKLLGIDESYTHFDVDIIIHINSALMVLQQLGVITIDNFFITDSSNAWADLIGDSKNIEAIKTYVFLKVKMVFDQPTTSFTIDAINRQIVELEWRLNNQVEGAVTT